MTLIFGRRRLVAIFLILFVLNPFFGIGAMMLFTLIKWGRQIAQTGRPKISGDGIFGMVVGTVFMAFGVFGYLDQLRHEERDAPIRQAQHDKFAPTICPRYFDSNIIQRWNDGPAWCRDYPQFDPSKAASTAKIDNAPTASTTPNQLWK